MLARRDSWFAPTLLGPGAAGFPKFMAELLAPLAPAPTGTAVGRAPRVNVREGAEAFVVEADVPGCTREQLTIELEDGALTLGGSWSAARDTSADDGTVHRCERACGTFQRTLQFGTPLDAEHVTADLRDGVLTVRLPKAAAARPRRIGIEVRGADGDADAESGPAADANA